MNAAQSTIYDLGTHMLTTQEDQSITIENETIAVQLDREEAYKLLLVLQEVFKEAEREPTYECPSAWHRDC